MTKRFTFLVLLIVIFSSAGFAQKNWGGGVDDEPLHFGFTFQYVSAEYKILKKESWRDKVAAPPGEETNPPLYSVSSPVTPGFGLGFVSNFRMGNNADVRFTPALVFSDRLIDYRYSSNADSKQQDADFRQKKVDAVLIDFPLGIKVKSDRRKNFRAYFLAGAKYSIDIVSKKKSNDVEMVFTEKFLKNNRNILWYEAGIGLDLYFEFFKLSPEIKLANSVQSVLKPENHPYSAPIDKLFLRNLQFSLYFE